MTFPPLSQSDKIVPISKFRNRPSGNPVRIVEGYWSALREGGELPRRTQIDPRGLESVLEHVFILERVAPGVARFRIAGSQIGMVAGMEVRGMPISSLFHTSARRDVSAALAQCFDTPAVVETRVHAKPWQRGPALEGSRILLPMRCDLGRTSRILGALVLNGVVCADAYRLDMERHIAKPVYGEPGQVSEPISGAAESAIPFTPAPPRLELVHSSD